MVLTPGENDEQRSLGQRVRASGQRAVQPRVPGLVHVHAQAHQQLAHGDAIFHIQLGRALPTLVEALKRTVHFKCDSHPFRSIRQCRG
jgi:hypothetical protein